MKKHFISFIHKPKKVFILSILLAIIIGTFGYISTYKTLQDQQAKIKEGTIGGTIGTSIDSSGQHLTLSFLESGRVKSVSVKIGDKVKKGDVLATLDAGNDEGVLAQARATYAMTQANYQKVLNGATGPTIDVAKATVNTAQVNLDQAKNSQNLLIANAYSALLNSSFKAETVSDYIGYDAPTVSGTYTCDKEGSYILKTYSSEGGISVTYSGIEEGSFLLTDVPRAMGKCGLFLSFDKTKTLQTGIEFNIQIPNKNATNYNANYNAYQLALQTKEQVLAQMQATLDQANVNLTALATKARPEDIKIAQAQVDNSYGALIAQPAYTNTLIISPYDGIITNVTIAQGQIANPNTPAIELTINNN